jgi:hypothetical protein
MASQELEEYRVRETLFDDGKPWGWIGADGAWRALPKPPLIMAELGPPPFDVRLPSGEVRHVIHQP